MNLRLLYVSCFIVASICFFAHCVHNSGAAGEPDLRGEAFAGASTCASCHKNIYDSFVSTAHFNTSHPASKATVRGSFVAPDNVFSFPNGQQVVMDERADGLFQSSYLNGALQVSHRFDIAIGSGRKAQTFLYWKDGQYFQLPISFFIPARSWANSPLFPATHPRFDRVIPSTCFGCHSSMVGLKPVASQGLHAAEVFEQNQVIYGIDCERCHGPAAEHVTFHTDHPQEKIAMHITPIASLKNEQKLDLCGICHSGLKTPQKPAFAFKPGDALNDYFYPDFTRTAKASDLDVHGNQYQLFTASQCFRKSQGMNCSSCHNPHTTERDVQALSQRCLSCHGEASQHFCQLRSLPSSTLIANCIDCHMPALPSKNITLLTNGKDSPIPDSIRTHLIAVYEDATQRVIERLKKRLASSR